MISKHNDDRSEFNILKLVGKIKIDPAWSVFLWGRIGDEPFKFSSETHIFYQKGSS